MNRRRLLKTFLALLAAPPLARATTRPVSQRRTLRIQQSRLAGFQYHAGETVWSDLREGDELTLVREPDNRYDQRAVRVQWRGHKLGYVPRHENTAVSQMLDRGEPLRSRITELRQSWNPWERIQFAVELKEG